MRPARRGDVLTKTLQKTHRISSTGRPGWRRVPARARWTSLVLTASIGAGCASDGLVEDQLDTTDWGPPIDTSLPDAGDVAHSDVAFDADGTTDVTADADVVELPELPEPFAVIAINVLAAEDELALLHENPEREIEIPVAVEVDGRLYGSAELEIHGGFARTVPKLSYRITFDDDQPLQTVVFGAPVEAHRRLVLHASWIDPTYSRNCLTMDLIGALGGFAPRCQYANVSLNGAYQGFYVAIERIDGTWLERHGFDDEGLLIKAETHDANWAIKADPLAGYSVKSEGAPTDPVGALLDVLGRTPLTFADFETSVRPWLNLDDFMVWQLVHTLANNRDTFTKNYYLYRDASAPNPRFEVISWDADATWGLNWDGSAEPTVEGRWHGNDAFSPRLFAIEDYATPYLEEYRALVNDPVFEAMLVENLDERHARIAQFAQRDLDAWDRGISHDDAYADLIADVHARFEAMRGSLGASEGSGAP